MALRDPYDPRANAGTRLWDASYFRGKYYLYFGPAPALVMAAVRIVSGHMPPQRLAVAASAAAGLAGLALLLWEVRRRHFPGISAAALAGILFVAFNASWLPVALRRSAVWELPIVAAVACLWWAIYFLWKFHDSGGRARWAAAVGLAVGAPHGLPRCLSPLGRRDHASPPRPGRRPRPGRIAEMGPCPPRRRVRLRRGRRASFSTTTSASAAGWNSATPTS